MLSTITKIKIVKTISYRLIASAVSFCVGYYFTGSWKIASGFSIMELIVKPVIYFIHEELWLPYERRRIKHNS
jgi:uncharacterized membrane protein